VPTYQEAANLRLLVPRIASSLQATGQPYEILIMDDNSGDGTEELVRTWSERYPVELVVRTGRRDLSLAVLEGLRRAKGNVLVVMDADLSHPPEAIPELLSALDRPGVDFVIGSRFTPGGKTEDWGGHRRLNSYIATLLCRPLTGPIRDPMAGFFALRRETFEQADPFDPIGYKIGLEILCRCRCQNVYEVPITFANRKIGQSKLTLDQQSRYLVHLDRLYRSCQPGWSMVMRPILWALFACLWLLRRIETCFGLG